MADSDDWDGSSPWLFMGGLLVFFASIGLFLYDLAVGNDVLRAIGANAVGMALLITWAAHDTLRDPNSEVATRGGAAGTALLLYGLYLILAGVTIAATGLLFHDRAALGLWYVPLAIVSILAGFIIFPTAAVVGEDEESLSDAESAEDVTAGQEAEESTEHSRGNADVSDGSSVDEGTDSDSDESETDPSSADSSDEESNSTGE